MENNSAESQLVWEFFRRRPDSIFVDLGVNHPTESNQTWFLEQQGWTGLLVEPNPDLAKSLREQRPKSKTVQVAVGRPEQVGEVELQMGLASGHSALNPAYDTVLTGQSVRLPLRTLDSILTENCVTQVDFLSLDALEGLNLEKWKPQLILIEDFFYHRRKLTYLRNHGYRLVRRTGYHNWYVPQDSPHTLFSASSLGEIFNPARKRWISGPIIAARRSWRQKREYKKKQKQP